MNCQHRHLCLVAFLDICDLYLCICFLFYTLLCILCLTHCLHVRLIRAILKIIHSTKFTFIAMTTGCPSCHADIAYGACMCTIMTQH